MIDILDELNVENGAEVKPLYDYGVGVDTHRDFIQLCVLVRYGDKIKKYESEFMTAWQELLDARDWVKKIIEEKTLPSIKPEPLRYTIESTSTYHLPVIKAFGGNPCVVNPVLAGSSRRKTDKIDARMLSYQNMTGLWPVSFVVTPDIQEFRLLMKQREYHTRACTAISNRINNYILRFGHTLGSYKSVRSIENRGILEDMCREDYIYGYDDNLQDVPAMRFICPDGLPSQTKKIILNMYAEYDNHDKQAKYYQKLAIDYAKDIEWETDAGFIRGNELIKNLLTVPSVGESTVLCWLSEIVTPLRFESAKPLCAYCGCDPTLKVSAGKVTSQTRRSGNAKLHHQLMMIAGTCINRHKEPFGQWGYALRKKHAKGGYKKACGAVARRIATALYYVNKLNVPFSYEKYSFYKIDVPETDITNMEFSKRVLNILISNGLTDSNIITDSFQTGKIYEIKGFGVKAAQEIQAWINKNKILGGKQVKENGK